jgi:hypothetical protein
MRTTVTLDPDVVEQVKTLARQRNLTFKSALNDAIRAGLASERGGGHPYRLPSRPMGLRPGVDLSHALRMADSIEDDETVRKLELRK